VDRSPLIAAMLAHAVPGLHVASAGTHAVVGAPAAALTEAVLTEAVLAGRGLSAGGHTARQLTAGMVRDARLVLTATRAHRTYAVQLDASAADSAFTVRSWRAWSPPPAFLPVRGSTPSWRERWPGWRTTPATGTAMTTSRARSGSARGL